MLDDLVQENLDDEGLEWDQYVVFKTENQEFGIHALRVQEISTVLGTSKVPNAPPYIEGILNLRGRLASVINFRVKFGMETQEHDEDTRIIMVGLESHPIGILVDSVEEVLRIPDDKVEELPEAALATVDEYIVGVGMLDKRLIIILDLDKVLSRTELEEAGTFTKMVESVKEIVKTKKTEDSEGKEDIEAEEDSEEKEGFEEKEDIEAEEDSEEKEDTEATDDMEEEEDTEDEEDIEEEEGTEDAEDTEDTKEKKTPKKSEE